MVTVNHDPERWLADYERDGYLVVEDCIDADTLRTLQDKVGQILDSPDSMPDRLRRHIQFRTHLSRRCATRR